MTTTETPVHSGSSRFAGIRTRWSAVGAAVAICLGAGGVGVGYATTSSGDRPVYTAIEPCRLVDTRIGTSHVGPLPAALGTDSTATLSGWGPVGNCNLPTGTTALSLNVTAVGATLPTFVQLFPAGTTRPVTSNLNPAPGQPPTPNAATVLLSDTGAFSIYNLQGDVDVIIDVVGVFDHHDHNDLYYTQAQVDARIQTGAGGPFDGDDIVDNSLTELDIQDEPGVAFSSGNQVFPLKTTPSSVRSVVLAAPTSGYAIVNASAYFSSGGQVGNAADCWITNGGTAINYSNLIRATIRPEEAYSWVPISGTRVFTVGADPTTFRLVCQMTFPGGDVEVHDSSINVLFVPTSYACPALCITTD